MQKYPVVSIRLFDRNFMLCCAYLHSVNRTSRWHKSGQDINHLAATARTRQHDSARADRGHGRGHCQGFPAVWYQDKQSTERSTSTCTAPCTCVCQALCFGMVWPGKASCWHQDTTPPVTPGPRTLLLSPTTKGHYCSNMWPEHLTGASMRTILHKLAVTVIALR